MDFLLSPELIEFRDSIRSVLASKSGSEFRKARLLENDARDLDAQQIQLWSELAGLGLCGAAIPEAHDGMGFGHLATHLILEESARALTPLPIFETLGLFSSALLSLGSDAARAEYLPAVSAGKLKGTLALNGVGGSTVKVKSKGKKSDTVSLSGKLDLVPALTWTDVMIVVAESQAGVPGLYLLSTAELAQAGKVRFQQSIDLLRPHFAVELAEVQAKSIGRDALSKTDLEQLNNLLGVFAAAELSGAVDAVEELTIDYVKTRNQFGKPIGSFQAIQHKLSDVHVVSEGARSLGRFAAWAADNDLSQFTTSALAAKVYASDSVPGAIEACLQAHGGIGFTFEYDLHLYLRRAQLMSRLYGAVSEKAAEVAKSYLAS